MEPPRSAIGEQLSFGEARVVLLHGSYPFQEEAAWRHHARPRQRSEAARRRQREFDRLFELFRLSFLSFPLQILGLQ